MQDLLRWLASWKDIAVEPGTELRFELASFPEGGLGLLVLLGIASAIGLVVFAYRRDGHRVAPRWRVVLATLRALAILVACLVLLEPNLVTVKRDIRAGHTLVLVDTSQSMGHMDTYLHPEVASLSSAWREFASGDLAQTPRIELTKKFLAKNDYEILTELSKHNKVLVYGFDSQLAPLAVINQDSPEHRALLAEQGVPAETTELDLSELTATGRYTNLDNAIRRALENSRDAAVAGIVIISDGRRNLGAQGPEVARLLKQRKIPHVYLMPVGDPSATRTVTLTRIEAPDKAFQKDPFTIRANIESQGYDDLSLTVHLKRQIENGKEAVTIRTETVRLGTDNTQVLVEFDSLKSEEPGLFTYLVELEPPSLEAPSPERHIQRAQVEVLGEQTRVLVIAGGPSHEFQILRMMLMRDKTIEVATWLLSADANFPQDGNIQLEKLPEEIEDFEKFDVFIVMDPDSRKLTRPFCDTLAQQVLENGAGMWWVCGEKYTLDAIRPTKSTEPLTELLPVVLDLEKADREYGLGRGMPRARPFEITPEGETHKATRLVSDRTKSADLWGQLPGFHFVFPVAQKKPAAKVLVQYSQQSEFSSGPLPLMATQYIGAGRVLFTATDDIYRWRTTFEHGYNRFWVKGIRYLFEGRLNAGDSRLRITLDEEKIELGQPIKIHVEARTETFQPLIAQSYNLTISKEDGTDDSLTLKQVAGQPGHFETNLRPKAIGYYRITPVALDDGRMLQVPFQVVPAAIEKEGPADFSELGAIASAPGGELLKTPHDLAKAVRAIESTTAVDSYSTPHAIWDSWLTVALILSLLAAEWLLRKRCNLL